MIKHFRPLVFSRMFFAALTAAVIVGWAGNAGATQSALFAPTRVPGFPPNLVRAVYRGGPAVEPGWSWYVVVGASSTCEGQQACMAASVLGAPHRSHGPGTIVNLMTGVAATYVPMQCHGAGCEPATLTFDRGTETVRVGMRTSQLATLKSVAASLVTLK